jgi:hypothetical protein
MMIDTAKVDAYLDVSETDPELINVASIQELLQDN